MTSRIKYAPPFTTYVVRTGVLTEEPFSLVDVGASGGIERHWNAFGDNLTAVGFEPLIAETQRLNQRTANPRVRYYAVRVTSRDRSTARSLQIPCRKKPLIARTSAFRAMCTENYIKRFYDPTGIGSVSDDTITIDEWYSQNLNSEVDFIKTDTDGHDYYVMRGAEITLSACPVLGISIECQFDGPVHPHANVFSNIDRLLRRRGFSLFGLDVYRYSRAVLPKPFWSDLPANTTDGQVLSGDAIYMRDAGDPEYEQSGGLRLSAMKLLKLACVQEIFGCQDCSAELLLKYAGQLRDYIDVERGLDLLTPRFHGEALSFRDYNRRFDTNWADWCPKTGQSASIEEKLASMEERVAELEDSSCWKLTAPLRLICDSARRLMSVLRRSEL